MEARLAEPRPKQRELRLGNDVRIAVMTSRDVTGASDTLLDLRALVLDSEPMYPGIGGWLEKKVFAGVRSGNRVAMVGYHNEVPVASAVVKRESHAKFCHLHLRDDLQDRHLGELFFSLMANEIRDIASTIHFTLPGGLWEEKSGFFSSFGFSDVAPCDQQYRLFEQEYRCQAPFPRVWRAVSRKLPRLLSEFTSPGRPLLSTLLMTLRPPYAERVLEGRKRIEIRRKFSPRWKGHRFVIYASSPVQRLVGEACIADVSVDHPDRVWTRWSTQIGCTRAEYEAYTRGADRVFAIHLSGATRYEEPIGLQEARQLAGERIRPPQSYCVLDEKSAWGVPVAVGTFLRARLWRT